MHMETKYVLTLSESELCILHTALEEIKKGPKIKKSLSPEGRENLYTIVSSINEVFEI